MSDSLRDRMAQTVWQEWAVETGQSMPAGMADKLADAVIRELGLREETVAFANGPLNGFKGGPYDGCKNGANHRYVTEWEPSD